MIASLELYLHRRCTDSVDEAELTECTLRIQTATYLKGPNSPCSLRNAYKFINIFLKLFHTIWNVNWDFCWCWVVRFCDYFYFINVT